jgi:hypothetical protein
VPEGLNWLDFIGYYDGSSDMIRDVLLGTPLISLVFAVLVFIAARQNQKSPQTMEVPNTHPLAYKYGVGLPRSTTPAGAPFGAPYVVGAAFGTAPQYPSDAPNMGFAVLSFFLPVVGLILYLVWKDQFPFKAKSCGKGALIGALVEIILPLIIFGVFVVIVALL